MAEQISAKILIIDDDESFCVVTANLLRLDGHLVDYVVDLYAGYEYLKKQEDTELVLLDIDLGTDINGIEAISELLAINHALQIVMLTSQRELETGIQSMKQGACDYLTKPFRREDLARILPGALERRRLGRLNSLYLEMLVHDLKNPLQSIKMGIDVLVTDNGAQDEKIRERAANLLKFGTWQIENMISNILNVSKFEKYTPPLKPEKFRLKEEVPAHIRPLADRILFTGKKFEIHFSVPDRFSITTDKALFLEVIDNLLTNAMRYTGRGDIISLVFAKATGGGLEVEVSNTGSFIEEEFREKIFDKFFKTRYRNQHQTRNFGLGLTFSKLAARALGGDIRVASEAEPPRTSFFFSIRNGK